MATKNYYKKIADNNLSDKHIPRKSRNSSYEPLYITNGTKEAKDPQFAFPPILASTFEENFGLCFQRKFWPLLSKEI
jgi:hypothetical protein